MRIDPDPGGSELQLLGQYLDYQRETVLLKSDGLTPEISLTAPPFAMPCPAGRST
jgi:hypothetical protein